MAAGLAAAVANGFMDALGNASNYTAPTAFWVQLHTADPGAAGTTAVAAETTRKQASFAAASGGAITTDAALDWTAVAANETITHISFWTASSAGTFLGSDALDSSAVLSAGGNFTIASGDLTVSITPLAA